MNSLFLHSYLHVKLNPSSSSSSSSSSSMVITNQIPFHRQPPRLQNPPRQNSQLIRKSTISPEEGQIPLLDFEEFSEKDWSFLDDPISVSNMERIIAAGEIGESSRVMVSAPSEEFVDRLSGSSYTQCSLLVVVHDSLFVLAGIKEKHDKVKCWQGEFVYVPLKWAPLDVMFLYFLPSLPFTLHQVLEAASKCCLPGSRVVISHPQGREVLEQQRKQYPDVIVSDLPEKLTLQKVASNYSFDLVEFVDDPSFYLAVLKFGTPRD